MAENTFAVEQTVRNIRTLSEGVIDHIYPDGMLAVKTRISGNVLWSPELCVVITLPDEPNTQNLDAGDVHEESVNDDDAPIVMTTEEKADLSERFAAFKADRANKSTAPKKPAGDVHEGQLQAKAPKLSEDAEAVLKLLTTFDDMTLKAIFLALGQEGNFALAYEIGLMDADGLIVGGANGYNLTDAGRAYAIAQGWLTANSEAAPESVEYVPQVGDVVEHLYSSVVGTVVEARHDKYIYLVDFGNEKPNQVLPRELILQQPHAEIAPTADALPTIEPPQIGVRFSSYGVPTQGVITQVNWYAGDGAANVEVETFTAIGDGRYCWWTQWYRACDLTLDLSVRRPVERVNADDRERATGCESDNRYNYERHSAVGKISEELI